MSEGRSRAIRRSTWGKDSETEFFGKTSYGRIDSGIGKRGGKWLDGGVLATGFR